MKKLIPLILIILASSCTKINEDKIIGTWEVEKFIDNGKEVPYTWYGSYVGSNIEFTDENRMIVDQLSPSYAYFINDNFLQVMTTEYKASLSNKKLKIHKGTGKLILKRK